MLGKSCLNHALVIKPCRQIHSIGMQFAFDVIFINRFDQVVYLERQFTRGKVSPLIKEADFVIELPVGTIDLSKTEEGDTIAFIH